MAAEIKPAVGGSRTTGDRKLTLLAKVEGFSDDVHDAVFIDGEDGIITASDDKYGLHARSGVCVWGGDGNGSAKCHCFMWL